MGQYNQGLKYNLLAMNNGLTYNYMTPVVVINVQEIVRVSDISQILMVKLALGDKVSLTDLYQSTKVSEFSDSLSAFDQHEYFPLVIILEKLNITAEFVYLLTAVHEYDVVSIKEDLTSFLLSDIADELSVSDNLSLEVLLSEIENLGLSDLFELIANISHMDNIVMADVEPRTLEADFVIGPDDGFDMRYDWLVPFGLLVSADSDFQIMPSTVSTYIDLPNVDGSIVKDTLYKNRFFNIVGYSISGLRPEEIIELEKYVTEILHRTKNEKHKLLIKETGLTFDVKYSGTMSSKRLGSQVRMTIPFESSPYGTQAFPVEINGDGLVLNNGVTDVGVICTITGPCSNPHFQIGDFEFEWDGDVPDKSQLVIDNTRLTCYIIDRFGVRSNAMSQLIKGYKFTKTPAETSEALVCLNTSTRNSIFSVYQPLFLW